MSRRQCGVTGLAPREGEEQILIRLAAEDCMGETFGPDMPGKGGLPLTPGLYQVNKETYEKFQPRVARRLMKTQRINGDGFKVFDADGNPVMYVGHESEAHGNMVM